MSSKKYIHYGHDKFDKDLFCPVINRELFNKPFGGLWASPVDAVYGWKEWNDNEHFRECDPNNSFIFTLSENAKVLEISSVDDLEELPQIVDLRFPMALGCCLDFEKLMDDGYDAIELNMSSDGDLYWKLYGWDCDSILVMNPDIVKM